MKPLLGCIALAVLSLLLSAAAQNTDVALTTPATAQSAASSPTVAAQVPRLVKFAGTLRNFNPDEANGGSGRWGQRQRSHQCCRRNLFSLFAADGRSPAVVGGAECASRQDRALHGATRFHPSRRAAGRAVQLRSGAVAGSATGRSGRAAALHVAERTLCSEGR